MIAYLSGAMESADGDGAAWRNEITMWLAEELNHSAIDPVKETQQLIIKNDAENYREWKSTDPKRFIDFVRKAIHNDLNSVKNRCDYLICLWNDDVLAGGGTHGEVTMAFDHGIPIYLINQLTKGEISGWIMSCATEVFNNFEELKEHLLEKSKK